jgi:hypothetical protein
LSRFKKSLRPAKSLLKKTYDPANYLYEKSICPVHICTGPALK